jgi:hypothetical protein
VSILKEDFWTRESKTVAVIADVDHDAALSVRSASRRHIVGVLTRNDWAITSTSSPEARTRSAQRELVGRQLARPSPPTRFGVTPAQQQAERRHVKEDIRSAVCPSVD